MDTKQAIILETTINDKTFTFSMPTDATFGSAIDASYEIYTKIIEMAAEAAKNNKAKEKSSDVKE